VIFKKKKSIRTKLSAIGQGLFTNFQRTMPLIFSIVTFGFLMVASGGLLGMMLMYGYETVFAMGALPIVVSLISWKKAVKTNRESG
jgi:hypothetical protein